MSLFDIAAGLSQFTGANDDDDHHHRVAASSEASTLALQRTASGNDADVAARAVLRQLSDEIDQLSELHGSVDGSSRAVTAANTARFLAEKYINTQLLVRKKALLKIQQLERRESTTASSAAPPAVTSGSAETSAPTVELWRRLGALTAPQHALLQRLARVPDAQMAALPQTQQELAQFARRYEQVRAMSARDIARLQPHQQQIVRQLQRGTQRPLPSLHA
ncbi:hypothetical protein PybrP1_000250 [[Pythium] brassicae (nom. inval.)]|nr:hypothetical protein PybrP1_000250 [[Pythium] brassicae (nom. inval.)]